MSKKSREPFIQVIKFTLLSLSAAAVEAISFFILRQLTPFPYNILHTISIVLSVIWNFTLNRRYTFKSAANPSIAMVKVAIFYVFFIPITAWLGQMAADAGTNEFIIKALTMLANFFGEFTWWKFVVFRGTENTNALAKKTEH